jgi:hypothetical protein
LKLLEQEARVRKITQKRGKMKKKSIYHIIPRCQVINLMQICKILEEDKITSCHNVYYRATMMREVQALKTYK